MYTHPITYATEPSNNTNAKDAHTHTPPDAFLVFFFLFVFFIEKLFFFRSSAEFDVLSVF